MIKASSQISFSHRKLFGSHWGYTCQLKAVWSGEEEWNLRRLRERFNALRKRPRVTAPVFISGNPRNRSHAGGPAACRYALIHRLTVLCSL